MEQTAHLGDILALTCALTWAFGVLLFRRASSIDPQSLNLFKNVGAVVLLAMTMLVLGKRVDWNRPTHDWLLLVGSATLGITVGDSLFFAGLQRITPGVAAVTDCLFSPMVVMISVIWLGEPFGGTTAAGAALVVSGLVVVSWQAGEGGNVDRRGVLLAVGGVLATAVGFAMARPVLVKSDLVEVTTLRLLVASVTLATIQLVRGRASVLRALFTPGPHWRLMWPPTVVGPFLSMLMWLGAAKYTTASRAALLNQMSTVFLLVLSRMNGEVMPARRWVGAGLAFAGAMLVLLG